MPSSLLQEHLFSIKFIEIRVEFRFLDDWLWCLSHICSYILSFQNTHLNFPLHYDSFYLQISCEFSTFTCYDWNLRMWLWHFFLQEGVSDKANKTNKSLDRYYWTFFSKGIIAICCVLPHQIWSLENDRWYLFEHLKIMFHLDIT